VYVFTLKWVTVIIDNIKLFLIYNKIYITVPAIAKHMQAGHNWPPARRAYAPEGMLEYWNVGVMGFGEDVLLITSILTR
jgi:hypothetical protein